MRSPREFDPHIEVVVLNYAIRLLFSQLDPDVMIERAAESLLDMSQALRVGLFQLSGDGSSLRARGGMVGKAFVRKDFRVPVEPGPCATVIEGRSPGRYALDRLGGLPWPVADGGRDDLSCLAWPLLAADNRCMGMVTFEYQADQELPPDQTQPLLIFLTTAALALETARLFSMAVTDGLTGCYVRRYFDIRIAEEEARLRRYGGELSIIVLDLDHFKDINDQGGHQTGDAALRELARVLLACVRDGVDVVCRYGGDEFVLILPNTGTEGARTVARRIRAALCEVRLSAEGHEFCPTVSMGIAGMGPDIFLSGEELFARADQALYAAKQSGRDCACAFGD